MSLLLLLNERVGMVYNMVYTNVTYFVNYYYKFRYPMTTQHIILLLLLCLLYLPNLHRNLVSIETVFFENLNSAHDSCTRTK